MNLRIDELFDQEAHDGEVLSAQFSPTGKYVATGGSDRKVKIWESGRGAYVNPFVQDSFGFL